MNEANVLLGTILTIVVFSMMMAGGYSYWAIKKLNDRAATKHD